MKTSKLKINYFPEISAILFGRAKPAMVSVNITEKCNQNCLYCEIGKNPSYHSEDNLTSDDLFWIIDQMAINKLKRLSLCGGEPFLFDSITEVVAYAWKNNVRCTITSNGMTIHKLKEREIEILRDCETVINISVDSFQDSIQTRIRGTNLALTNAIKSIQLLIFNDIPVTVLTAISKYNYWDLFNSIVRAYENGISQVLYQPVIYFSNYPDKPVIKNKSNLNVSPDKIDILMDQLYKIQRFERIHRINTNVYRILPWISHYINGAANLNGDWFFNDVLKKFYCREVDAVIDISYFGGIQPCGLIIAEKNIRENRETGLLAQWSEATAKLKDDIKNNRLPRYCNGCCHKFSRNMLASIIRYPLANRVVLVKVLSLMISRWFSKIYKHLFITSK